MKVCWQYSRLMTPSMKGCEALSVQVLRANPGKTFDFPCLLGHAAGSTLAGSTLSARMSSLPPAISLRSVMASDRCAARAAYRIAEGHGKGVDRSAEKPSEDAGRACLTPWRKFCKHKNVRDLGSTLGAPQNDGPRIFAGGSRRPSAALSGLVHWCTDIAAKPSCAQ